MIIKPGGAPAFLSLRNNRERDKIKKFRVVFNFVFVCLVDSTTTTATKPTKTFFPLPSLLLLCIYIFTLLNSYYKNHFKEVQLLLLKQRVECRRALVGSTAKSTRQFSHTSGTYFYVKTRYIKTSRNKVKNTTNLRQGKK